MGSTLFSDAAKSGSGGLYSEQMGLLQAVLDADPVGQGARRQALPFALPGVAFVLEDALSQAACAVLQQQASTLGFAATAGDYPPSYRDNDRLVCDDAELADWLFTRLSALLPSQVIGPDGALWDIAGLNSRFRFCRYRDGQGFRIHQDGAHAVGAELRSLLTLQVYLDDDLARQGGRTRFFLARQGGEQGSVAPRIGRAIVFEHRLWHDGEPVWAGEKHVMRTDVLYRRRALTASEPPARSTPPTATALSGHDGYIFSLLPLRDGRLASGSRDRTIRIWQPGSAGWQEQSRIVGHVASVVSLVELASGLLLSAARDHTVRCSDLASGQSAPLLALPSAALALAACDAQHFVVSCADGSIGHYRLGPTAEAAERSDGKATAHCLARLTGHDGWVWAVAALSPTLLAAAGDDGTLRLWHLPSRQAIAEKPLGHGPVHALLHRRDGSLLAGCADGHLLLLAPPGLDAPLVIIDAAPAHSGEVYALCEPQSGGLASAGEDGYLHRFDAPPGRIGTAIFPSLVHGSFVRCLAALPDGWLASGAYDGVLRLWPPSSARGGASFAALGRPV